MKKKHPFRASFNTDPFGWIQFKDQSNGVGYAGAFHKGASEGMPYRIANEFVCGKIGEFIGLPVPPFGITQCAAVDDVPAQSLFTSLDFNCDRDSVEPINPDACMAELPELCAGILAFDILIANPDRLARNLWADDGERPTKMLVFDHDHALLGSASDGVGRLTAMKEQLGLAFLSSSGQGHHCFRRRLPSIRLMDDWFNRIHGVQPWFVRNACDALRQHIPSGFTKPTIEAIVDFVDHRRRNLERIILANRSEFTGVADWCQQGSLFQ